MPRSVQKRALKRAWFLDWVQAHFLRHLSQRRGLCPGPCRPRPRTLRDSGGVPHALARNGEHCSPSWGHDAGPQGSHRFAVPFQARGPASNLRTMVRVRPHSVTRCYMAKENVLWR